MIEATSQPRIAPSKLAEIRERAGFTQEQLAIKVGKKKQHISHYENGVAVPPGNTLVQILSACKATILEVSENFDLTV